MTGHDPHRHPPAVWNGKTNKKAWHLEEAQPSSRQGPWIQGNVIIPTAQAGSHVTSAAAAIDAGIFTEAPACCNARYLPNEAAFKDCLDDFDDFDWGEFDMECQAACNAIDKLQGAESGARDTCETEGQEDGEGGEIECNASDSTALIEDHNEAYLLEADERSEAVLPGPDSQLFDCKTTNAGIQIHRYLISAGLLARYTNQAYCQIKLKYTQQQA